MKKLIHTVLFCTGLMTIASPGYAGDSQGVIKNVHFMKNGVVIFYVVGTHNNVADCAPYTTVQGRWAVNGTTLEGKVQVSGLMSAYMAGKTIAVSGNAPCDTWNDTETLDYFYTVDS